MARTLEVQSTFSSGEAEPRLVERRDVQFYYSAIARGRNCVALPQGGFSSLPGTVSESQLRNPVASLGFAGATITAPNGGTVGNLTDADPTTVCTTSSATAGTFVVAHVDLGSAKTWCAFDVYGFYAVNAGEQKLVVQWSADNAAWNTIATVDVEAGAANRRNRRFARPPGAPVTARYVRVATVNGLGLAAVSVGGIAIFGEGAFTGSVRLAHFNFRKGQEYTLALTPGHGDVFKNGVWQAAFMTSATANVLAEMDWTQSLDSFLMFHEALETPLIKRQGRDTEWNFTPYPFRNLPLYDFGGTYTNGRNAVQRIQLYNMSVGETFDLTLEGETTVAIEYFASSATTIAAIKAAIEALPNVVAGVTVGAPATTVFDVEFTGGSNAAREWLLMAGTSHAASGAVVVRELARGGIAGEYPFGSTKGYALSGAFHQQSLIMAGFGSLPRHVLKSITGAPDDFNTDIDTAIGGMFFEVAGRTSNEIVRIHAGQSLLLFTTDDVLFLDGNVLAKSSVPTFQTTEQPGLKRGIPLAALDGGLIYVEAGGNIVRELKFADALNNFSAQNISVLSAHLLNNPVDLAHRRAVRTEENDLVHIVNADGTMILMTALRSESITGFTLRSGNGQFKAVTNDSEQNVRVAVARDTAGVSRLWLERIDRACVTEAAHVATGVDITAIALPAAFDGETLHVFCDHAYVGTRTVAAGAIAGLPASARIEAGYAALADVVDMPVLKDDEANRPMARQKRVVTVHLSLFETDHIALQVNDGEIYEVPLMELGVSELGESVGDRPFTGTVHLEGFPGFTETGQVRILQLRPGRLTVRSMRKEMRV